MNILEAIVHNAGAYPERPAYVVNTPEGASTLSWRDLGEWSDRIATHIVDTVEGTTPVIIYGHKDPLVIASFVACSKSGRAYVPVDVSVPSGRLQDIVHEVSPALIIALEELPDIDCGEARVLGKEEVGRIARQGSARDVHDCWVGADDVYYIIFTSGSTGKPKGVQITRDCLDNFVRWGQTLCANAADKSCSICRTP